MSQSAPGSLQLSCEVKTIASKKQTLKTPITNINQHWLQILQIQLRTHRNKVCSSTVPNSKVATPGRAIQAMGPDSAPRKNMDTNKSKSTESVHLSEGRAMGREGSTTRGNLTGGQRKLHCDEGKAHPTRGSKTWREETGTRKERNEAATQ